MLLSCCFLAGRNSRIIPWRAGCSQVFLQQEDQGDAAGAGREVQEAAVGSPSKANWDRRSLCCSCPADEQDPAGKHQGGCETGTEGEKGRCSLNSGRAIGEKSHKIRIKSGRTYWCQAGASGRPFGLVSQDLSFSFLRYHCRTVAWW